MQKPLVIAHRGDSSRALENSLEAFRLALSVPVDMIEFDIRKSRDSVLYVMHDRETGRTAKEHVDIERSLSGDIAHVRLKNGEPVPALSDVLALVDGRVGLNIEVKSKGAGALVAAYLAASGYKGKVLLSSFREAEVEDALRTWPGMSVAGIFDTFILPEVTSYKAKGYGAISLNRKTVSRELIDGLHGAGILVYVWTIDEEREMREVIDWGADGVYSNRPLELRAIVG